MKLKAILFTSFVLKICNGYNLVDPKEYYNDVNYIVKKHDVSDSSTNLTIVPNLVELAERLKLTKFVEALKQTNLNHILNHEGPFTVFAPNDDAFNKAPSYCKNVALEDRMKYHVTRSLHPAKSLTNDQRLWSLLSHRYVRVNIYKKTEAVTASGRQVILADQKARNGIIHVIKDEICSIYKGGAMFEINRCPSLSYFTEAVNASELFSTLDTEDPITVFAPTNEAIEALPPAVRTKLMSNSTFLKQVVLNHIVPQTMYKAGLYDGQVLKTAAGFKLFFSVSSSSIKISGKAKITLPDAAVENGVVHSIDGVLLPKSL